MNFEKCAMPSFTVIGKLGSTEQGEGFIQNLWQEVHQSFNEIDNLIMRDESGQPLGFWGAMSDLTGEFKPWTENYSQGLYLAGVQVSENTQAPPGWTKWTLPAREYIYIKVEGEIFPVFQAGLIYLRDQNLRLAGAVQEYYCPEENGQLYLFFPVKQN